jgi:crotonobetainyl-CoA:carnitine CoA-transferase CaiB-like acyl-CoA transferase
MGNSHLSHYPMTAAFFCLRIEHTLPHLRHWAPRNTMAVLPLAGIRVLDLTRLLPGGYAAQILADLGADVLKIEEPGSGDYSRTMAPLAGTLGHGFLAVNRNKRSAAINLKHPHGREALLRLVDEADVLLESFRPGVLARLDLAHETLRVRNPRLIVCAITGYGQHGPYSQRAGHDLNYIGYAGLLAHLARPNQPPTLPGAQLADIAGGGLMAVVGILAALVGRGGSGEGGVVDVSMLDGTLALMPLLASMLLNGWPEPAPGEGWLSGALPGYNVYETADGRYITLGALEPKFWVELCRRLNRPDLITHQMPSDDAERRSIEAELAAIFRTRTRDEWVAELGDAEVCLGPVNSLVEALDDPQVRARGLFAPLDLGPLGEGDAMRFAPAMSDVPFTVRSGPPALGAHTAEALRAVGYTAEEIAELEAEAAIATT